MVHMLTLVFAAGGDVGSIATNTEHLVMRIGGALLAIILAKHVLKHHHDMSPGGIVASLALGVIAAGLFANPSGVISMLENTAKTIHFG